MDASGRITAVKVDLQHFTRPLRASVLCRGISLQWTDLRSLLQSCSPQVSKYFSPSVCIGSSVVFLSHCPSKAAFLLSGLHCRPALMSAQTRTLVAPVSHVICSIYSQYFFRLIRSLPPSIARNRDTRLHLSCIDNCHVDCLSRLTCLWTNIYLLFFHLQEWNFFELLRLCLHTFGGTSHEPHL